MIQIIGLLLFFLLIVIVFTLWSVVDKIKELESIMEMESNAIDELYDEVFPDEICSCDTLTKGD